MTTMKNTFNLKDTFARGAHVATETNPCTGQIFAIGRSSNPYWRIIVLEEKMVGGVNQLTPLVHEMKLDYSICTPPYESTAYGHVGESAVKWTFSFEHDETEDRFLHLKQVEVETEKEFAANDVKKYNAEDYNIISIQFAKNDFAKDSF